MKEKEKENGEKDKKNGEKGNRKENNQKKNIETENNKERYSIHTTVSKEAYILLEKYKDFKDKANNLTFKKKSQIIETALELLDNYYNPEKDKLQSIWNRAREDLNMVLVGKRTFLSYISGNYHKALEENIAIDIIEWYKGKRIHEMTLSELLEAIKCIWLAANYFYKIEIEVGSKGSYQVTFYHDFHSKEYSEYWGAYFSQLLSRQKKCETEIFARIESLILRISPSH